MWIQFPWLMLQSCETTTGKSSVGDGTGGNGKKSAQPYWDRKKIGDGPAAENVVSAVCLMQ